MRLQLMKVVYDIRKQRGYGILVLLIILAQVSLWKCEIHACQVLHEDAVVGFLLSRRERHAERNESHARGNRRLLQLIG